MSAWEITSEDIIIVLSNMGYEEPSERQVEAALDVVDADKVERAALYGDDMSDQVDMANIEIEEQLIEHCKAFGKGAIIASVYHQDATDDSEEIDWSIITKEDLLALTEPKTEAYYVFDDGTESLIEDFSSESIDLNVNNGALIAIEI